jgi:hypothetical protein
VALGAAGATVLAALLAMAAARLVQAGGQPAASRRRRRSVLDLTAALFAIQLAIFLVQETVEAVAAGAALPTAGDVLLWGCLGQLPAAAVAGLALSWLGARVESAVTELEAAAARPLAAHAALRPPIRSWRPAPAAAPRRLPAGAVSLRGPPPLPSPG